MQRKCAKPNRIKNHRLYGKRKRNVRKCFTTNIQGLQPGTEITHGHIVRLTDSTVTVSRLARGVPVGGELEYMDAGTLNQAFSDRRKI